jgi:hypothetical protein
MLPSRHHHHETHSGHIPSQIESISLEAPSISTSHNVYNWLFCRPMKCPASLRTPSIHRVPLYERLVQRSAASVRTFDRTSSISHNGYARGCCSTNTVYMAIGTDCIHADGQRLEVCIRAAKLCGSCAHTVVVDAVVNVAAERHVRADMLYLSRNLRRWL